MSIKNFFHKNMRIEAPLYLLGAAISLFAMIDTISAVLPEGVLTNGAILALFGYATTVIVVQTLIVATLYKKCTNILIPHTVMSLLIVVNIYLFRLSVTPDFIVQDIHKQLFILLASFLFILITLWKGHHTILSLATTALLIIFVIYTTNIVMYITADNNSMPLPANYKPLDFKHTPNIYLVSFDALIPEDVMTRYMGESIFDISYEDKLRQLGADVIANSYANRNTMTTLNSMLAMDLHWWYNLPEASKSKLISGLQNSPVYDTLRHNGYHISLLYKSNYLTRGEHKDIDARYHHTSVCDLDLLSKGPPFAWFCKLFHEPTEVMGEESIWYTLEQLHNIVTTIDGKKFITMYWHSPGHTSTAYRWGKDLAKFKKKTEHNTPLTNYLIETSIAIIQDNDPDAIILIFGDHGAYLLRGAPLGGDEGFTLDDFVDDRNKVILATINMPDNCVIEETEGKILIQKVVAGLISCLAEDAGSSSGEKADYARYSHDVYYPEDNGNLSTNPPQ